MDYDPVTPLDRIFYSQHARHKIRAYRDFEIPDASEYSPGLLTGATAAD